MTDHTKQTLLDLKAHQQSGSYRLCPRCGKDTMKQPLYTNALSRHTDLYICDACGMEEAILDYMHAHRRMSRRRHWNAHLKRLCAG